MSAFDDFLLIWHNFDHRFDGFRPLIGMFW